MTRKPSEPGGAFETSPTCSSIGPQFDLSLLFVGMTVAALWLALYPFASIGGRILLAVFGLTFVFGCWRTRRAVLWVLPSLYLPYVWLFLGWYFALHYQQPIGMLWQIPGVSTQLLLPTLPYWASHTLTTCVTLVLFFAAVLFARRSHLAAAITGYLLLLLGLLNNAVYYALFRIL